MADPRTSEPQLTHHIYDGIREYDNPMPAWWKRIFWGTFVFSIAYFLAYQCGDGVSVEEAYRAEVKEAQALAAAQALREGSVTEAVLAGIMNDAGSVAEGQAKFATTCVACHGPNGGGIIGPNLTDPYWLHGRGTLMDIYKVVSEGVLDKGMPAWSKQMSETQVRQVVAFVGTLRNRNVAGGKPPQGERVE